MKHVLQKTFLVLLLFAYGLNALADDFTVERAVNLSQLDSWEDISQFQWQEIDHVIQDNGAECNNKHPAPISLTSYAKRITSILTHLYIGPYPIHDVVVTAVSAAVSAATITFTTICQKFFLSFITL